MAPTQAASRWRETNQATATAAQPAGTSTGECHLLPSWWAGLALILGLGWAYPARAQGILEEVNRVFSQRLETTCRYQEAVETLDAARATCYLQVGQRQFLLASLQTLRPDSQRVREEYLLLARPHDTISVSKARYALSPPLRREGQQLSLGLFHEYPNAMTVEAGEVLVQAEFSPLALLSLQPGPARVGQRVWVQNSAPDFNGDTLACYELLPASTPGLYRMVLRERRTRGNRHWRHNNRRTCEWAIDPRARRVSAAQWLGNNVRPLRWERTYTSATDFVETCTGEVPVAQPLLESGAYTLYTRRFTQVNAREAHDIYTINNYDATEPALTFSLISHYE